VIERLHKSAPARVGMIVLLLAHLGCATRSHTRKLVAPQEVLDEARSTDYLKAHLPTGEVYVLSDWAVDPGGRVIAGSGSYLSALRDTLGAGEFTLPFDTVALVEVGRSGRSPRTMPLFFLTVVSVVVAGYCLSHTDECFSFYIE